MTSAETWRLVPGTLACEVSDQGRIRSFARNRLRYLTPSATPKGYQLTNVRGAPRFLHAAILLAFVGVRPEGMEVRHLNGDPADNRLVNLRYGTRSENALDTVRHGTHNMASKTECVNGHQFTPENTRLNAKGRVCRACNRAAQARYLSRRRGLVA